MKKRLLFSAVLILCLLELYGCSHETNYTSLSQKEKSRVSFVFTAKKQGNTPAAPYYSISVKVKNHLKKTISIKQSSLKLIGGGNKQSTSNKVWVLHPGNSIYIKKLFSRVCDQSIIGGNLFIYQNYNNILALADCTHGSMQFRSDELHEISKTTVKNIIAMDKSLQEDNASGNKKETSSGEYQTDEDDSKRIGEKFVAQYKKNGYLDVYKIRLILLRNTDDNSYIFKEGSHARMYMIEEIQNGNYMYHPMEVGNSDSFIELGPVNVDQFESQYNFTRSNFDVTYSYNHLKN